ncbi:MAG: hypothetical protein LC792_18640 [Actinobacteria bacterium]|nr:hypothetical protein [Actinomycetota bacterium]
MRRRARPFEVPIGNDGEVVVLAAHMLEQPPGVSITFADVHNAIDRVTDTFNELSMLVDNKTWHFPAAVTGDWRLPFRRPIFDPYPPDPWSKDDE